MAYYLVRFYSGSGNRTPEQLIREVVDSELRPRLQQGGGLTRYITFISDDGRLGSASVYENKAAAQKGLQIASEWAGTTEAMQGYQLSLTLEGEILHTFDGNLDAKPAYGAGRLWQTRSQGDEVLQMIERSGVPRSPATGQGLASHGPCAVTRWSARNVLRFQLRGEPGTVWCYG